ncbi:2-oxo acid dehydrogenase subunit E2 [Paraburkholderia phytofirmans]|uniref:2-oxo acid dehydrogenase subunit E2 n=1 Tax=Paraburkholderia phytofirmans TaxID=261302 RepID=UPI0038BC526E
MTSISTTAQNRDVSTASQTDSSGDLPYTDIPHTMTRRTIARRLTDAKQTVPHFYLKAACRVDALLSARAKLNSDAETKVSVNDIVVKAVANALLNVPEGNVSWGEDALRRYTEVDVAVAVATPRGLITPIVRNVERKTVQDVAREVRDLAERARQGRLKKEEYQGGNVSVSNLGMYGVDEFSAIVNPPQSIIFAAGSAVQQPVVEDGKLAVGTLMTITASVDHRAIDGAIAAQVLGSLKRFLENPAWLSN